MIPELPKLAAIDEATRAKLKQIEYEYHVRAFGEEMARVNFLPEKERMEYLYDMIDHAREKGVNLDRPARGVS